VEQYLSTVAGSTERERILERVDYHLAQGKTDEAMAQLRQG
jgi:hypothetical protein